MSLKKIMTILAVLALISAPALADKENKGLHLGGMTKEAKTEKIDARQAEAQARKAAKEAEKAKRKAEQEAKRAAKEAEKAKKKAEQEAKRAAKALEAKS